MVIMLFDLSVEQKIDLIFFSLLLLGICGILHLIKIKFEDKVQNKILRKILERL